VGLQPGGSSPVSSPHSSGGKSGACQSPLTSDGRSLRSSAGRFGPRVISNTIPGGGFSPNASRTARSASNRGQREHRGRTPVEEAESAVAERLQLEGGTPGHLPGQVAGDELVSLVHLGRPPMANPLQQAGQAGVGGGVPAQQEPHPVAARLDLAALAGPAFSLRQRLPEPFRPRRAELHPQQTLHPNHPNQQQLNPRSPTGSLGAPRQTARRMPPASLRG
jgi:hypothetical protein